MDRRFEGWSGRCGARGCAVLLACVCVALTLGLVASFATSAPSFAGPRSYRTGGDPVSVAIGDLNGDGKPDLATANDGADSVSVLANRGDGSFRAKRDYATGIGPYSVAIGDLNGDGKPDLATANVRANSVSVLLNRGDGSFRAKVDYRAGRYSVAIGDLNGDGRPDLATSGSYTAFVLANKGSGNFQLILQFATGDDPRNSIAIGDLNGDGRPDLVTANGLADSVSVLANATGLCLVPGVRGKTLPAAKRTMARANCRVGKIGRAYSKTVRKSRVISEKPKPGTVLPKRGKVDLVVSRGRKH